MFTIDFVMVSFDNKPPSMASIRLDYWKTDYQSKNMTMLKSLTWSNTIE